MRTPKLCLIVFPSFRGGGAEKVLVWLANELVSRGYTVHVVVGNAEGSYQSLVQDGVVVFNLKRTRMIECLVPLARHIRKYQPAVMLSTMLHVNIVCIIAKIVSLKKCRTTAREAMPLSIEMDQSSLLRLLAKLFYSRIDSVVSLTKCQELDRNKSVNIRRRTRQVVIANPVDFMEIYKASDEKTELVLPVGFSERPVIVACGRLVEQKNFMLLIRAFSSASRSVEASLLILGDGVQRDALQALINELGLAEKVHLAGFVDNPFPLIKMCSVFAVSSNAEGMPNALLHATAMGKPVVSTDCHCGPREIFEGLEGPILVPVDDVDAMAAALIKQLNVENYPAPSEQWKSRYDSQKIVDQYIDVMGL